MKKEFYYAAKLNDQIMSMFDENSENHIDIDEFENEENATAFIHALANIMPTLLFNNLTNDDKDLLQFNHVANQLVFQFAKSSD